MSVGRRLILTVATLVACTALLGFAALGGLLGLSSAYGRADAQYQNLRSLFEIGSRAEAIRLRLAASRPDSDAIQRDLYLAAQEADRLGSETSGASADVRVRAMGDSIRDRLRAASENVGDTKGIGADADVWLRQVGAMAAATQREIIENRSAAAAEYRRTVVVIGIVLVITVVLATVVATRQYRSIMRPLSALSGAVTRISGIHLDHRVPEQGDREFVRLARHFNRMGEAIQGLHISLREEVEAKSRQLLRSEQLASVGSLAAGLAHEINNPLAIIAGHAQTTLRRIDRAKDDREEADALKTARETLEIVCDEAFRCRDIAGQLLGLARPMDEAVEEFSLASLAARAAGLVGHLPLAKGKRLTSRVEGRPGELMCLGNAAQMLQVLINVLTNALEACPAEGGAVELSVFRRGESILLHVTDNGCGMDEHTVRHAFEPFFTDKPRRGLMGCGLGLSVSHAIVERHDGRLGARSAGPGCGSTFTIELPALHRDEPVSFSGEVEGRHVAIA